MTISPAHTQLFELWRQDSLSALSVRPVHLGLEGDVHPDDARVLLARAAQSWDGPVVPRDQPR